MEEQNDHELEDFCFRCSAKDPRYDAPAQEPLHNSWPLLARSDQLEYMRSQPVVRMTYSPIPLSAVDDINSRQKHTPANPDQLTAEARDDFVNWFNWLHEGGHLWCLDWTPAKEFARLGLVGIYTVIHQLLFKPRLRTSHIEHLWMRFNGYSRKFTEISKNIAFVEELVATANAITALEIHTESGQMWAGFQDELETCKEAALHQEATIFRKVADFQAIYSRFAPLMRLMYRNPWLRWYVMPLLQPVRLHKESGLTYVDAIKNSHENVQTILSLIEGIDNAKEVMQRLQPLHQEMLSGWHIVLAPYVVGMQHTREKHDFEVWIAQMLWRIARGELVARAGESLEEQTALMVEQIRNRITTAQQPVGPAIFAALWPGIDKGQALIGVGLRSCLDNLDDLTDPLIDDFIRIILFEGLRQQLRKRKGIVCPLSCVTHNLKCRCPESWYKAIKRLARLAAKDEAFGSGEWSLLPCRR